MFARRELSDYGKYQNRVLSETDPLLHREVSMELGGQGYT